jgi:hypothetical protein
MEYFSESQSIQHQVIRILEIICVIWFTVEIVLRFIVCPSKRKFVRQIMNWLDFAAIIPFYIQLFLSNTDVNSIVAVRIIRLIRVFRVFKLSRHSYSLQILGHTLRSSLSELFLLGFFLSIGVVVFSTLMFYAEQESEKFSSIPAGFWWAVVTMTTLGYGDIVPDTLPGKIVGTACAICGVLTIALPIPVIVSNFSLYYSHAKAKQKAVQSKRPLVIGAANALKVIDPFIGSRATNLRMSAISENASYMSPNARVRNWPKIALDMAGSSFESSEPPTTPTRRRFSKFHDKLWQFDQAKNFDNNNVKYDTTIKNVNEISAGETSQDYPGAFEDCRTNSKDSSSLSINRAENASSQSSLKTDSRSPNASYSQEEPGMDVTRGTSSSEAKKCHGAYENEAIEQISENDTTETAHNTLQSDDEKCSGVGDNTPPNEQYFSFGNTLPTIEIVRNSSVSQSSQMSGSNNEDESSDRPRKKSSKKTKKSHSAVEKATSAPSLDATNRSFSAKNLPGRMGRRGSVFVVGFLGKRWQAKAAKSRKNRRNLKADKIELSLNKSHLNLLEVSPNISPGVRSPNEESRRTSMTSFNTPTSAFSKSTVFRFPSNEPSPESSFFRRSSCPNLPKSSISEDKVDTNIFHNTCTREDNVDRGNKTGPKDVETSEIRQDTTHAELHKESKSDAHTKEHEVNTKQDILETKQDVDLEHNKVDINNIETDKKQHEVEKLSTEVDKKVTTIHEAGLNRKLSKERAIFHSKMDKSGTISKQEKLESNQRSLSSSQSDSSLKAELDGTIQRCSSPLIRQRAFISFPGPEGSSFEDSDDEIQDKALQDRVTIDHGVTIQHASDLPGYQGNSALPTASDNNKQLHSDIAKSRQSTINLMEIGKAQQSISNILTTDKKEINGPRSHKKENVKQEEIGNTYHEQKTTHEGCNEGITDANRNVFDSATNFESKLDIKTKKASTVATHNELKPEKVNQTTKTIESSVNENSDPQFSKFSKKDTENNNEVYFKGLVPENSGVKDKKSSQRIYPTHQKLLTGDTDRTKIRDDPCHKKNGTLPKDTGEIKDPNADEKGDINTKFGHKNTQAQNGGRSIPIDHSVTLKNNNWNSVEKHDTVNNPEHRNSTTGLVNVKKQSTRNLSKTSESITENKSIWRHAITPKFYSRNATYTGQYYSLRSSTSSQGSQDSSTSFEYTNHRGMPQKVETQDSGIYYSDYRSSIDSISSFTERNMDAGTLKTISEVEHDCRDDILYFDPFSGQYKNTCNNLLEKHEETVV